MQTPKTANQKMIIGTIADTNQVHKDSILEEKESFLSECGQILLRTKIHQSAVCATW